MSPFEQYIQELRDIRATGTAVKETSYYGSLANLLNAIGSTLKPKVRCFMQLKNLGAGMPDGGLFTAQQYQRSSGDQPNDPQNPERGVIEVKGTGDDAWVIAETDQVSKYWKKYRQILVTNYRDFVLIGQDDNGQPIKLETYRLAENEKEFWQKAQNPSAFAKEHEEQITEYLKRVMLQQAKIASPQDLAWFLASYAKDARARIEKSELPALESLRKALEEALGITFTGDDKDPNKGERFFKSTLIQTLFYGLFSAWVLWHKQGARRGYFDWQTAAWSLHVPMVKALFEKVATPTNLARLDLVEVLDWTGEAFNRVDREAFFSSFDDGQAVQYFYEPFLEAFDPKLRKELGVWYTPPEIVQYMVARVDTVLREELEIEDGLADPNVYILDPCCGTGAFLVEVLKRIEINLQDKGMGALIGSQLKEAAMNRVFGFEILTAPFVVAHLQLGLMLQNLGVPLSDDQERVSVYLTNALTGWRAPTEQAKTKFQQLAISYPELEKEREAADEVKQNKPILVILGNPPYNAYAGVSSEDEQGLVEPYKAGLISEWGIKKFNLDELYVRFFRLAEQKIAKKTQRGIVCYVSSFSYLSDSSFVVMRQHFLNEFDKLWFDCLNGDSRETGKLTPEGDPDPSVFSTTYNREGIRIGTAISLMVRRGIQTKNPSVKFRHYWGANKKTELLRSLANANMDKEYDVAYPSKINRFSFRPVDVTENYLGWVKLTELCAEAPFNGLFEKRSGALIDIDKDTLSQRMESYYNSDIDWEALKILNTSLTKNAARFIAKSARIKILNKEAYNSDRLYPYAIRPFDIRWCYYSTIRPLWNEPRPAFYAQLWKGNSFLMSRPVGKANPEGTPLFYSKILGDNDFLRGHAYYFPLRLRSSNIGSTTSDKAIRQMGIEGLGNEEVQTITANLSDAARSYLISLGINELDIDNNPEVAELIWMHVLAISYSPNYLEENSDGVRQDWIRIPLPNRRETLINSAKLGRQIAVLLDPETNVSGVTSGKLRPELKTIGSPGISMLK